jgi:hypothetical protein
MTRTSLATVEQAGFPEAGTELEFAAADVANGNSFVASGGEVIFARNTGASSRTVQFSYHRRGQLISQTAVSIAAGKTMMFGPFVEEMTEHDPVDAGQVYVTASNAEVELASRRQLAGYSNPLPEFPLDDLMIYWKFDEEVTSGTGAWVDQSGNGYDFGPGTDTGADNRFLSTLDADRGRNVVQQDMTISFAQSAGTVQLDDVMAAEAGSADPPGLSVCFWYKAISGPDAGDGSQTPAQCVSFNRGQVLWRNGNAVPQIRAYPNVDGSLQVWMHTSTTETAVFSGALTGWNHIGVTYDKATRAIKMYINGVLVDSDTLGADLVFTVAVPIQWAGSRTTPATVWRHSDWVFYSRALDADEVDALYQLTE